MFTMIMMIYDVYYDYIKFKHFITAMGELGLYWQKWNITLSAKQV